MAAAKWPARYRPASVQGLGKAVGADGKPSLEQAVKKGKAELAKAAKRTGSR